MFSRRTQFGSSALSVQLQTKSSELTYSSQQLGWSSGKAERLIAEILQIIDSKRLLLLSAPKVRKNRLKCSATMREVVEQGGSLLVCLPIGVQRAALKAPPPFGRTLSFPQSATRLFEVRTPVPKQVWVPFRRFCPVALGVGRDGTPVGQACTADSGQTTRKSE
jgi:hypothetical protein